MDNYKISVLSYNFLIILEALQILFFAYQNTLPYMWTNQVIKYSLEVLNYIQFDKISETNDNAVKMSVFYICIITIAAVYLFFLIITIYFDSKDRHNKATFKYSVKLCCFFLILHNTVLTIPIYQSIFNMLICVSGSRYSASVEKCYSGVSLLNLILACFATLLFFIELLFANLFLNEMNPSSKLPQASFNLNQNFLKMIIKILLPLFTAMDGSVGYV
jgi:hypothetical protein